MQFLRCIEDVVLKDVKEGRRPHPHGAVSCQPQAALPRTQLPQLPPPRRRLRLPRRLQRPARGRWAVSRPQQLPTRRGSASVAVVKTANGCLNALLNRPFRTVSIWLVPILFLPPHFSGEGPARAIAPPPLPPQPCADSHLQGGCTLLAQTGLAKASLHTLEIKSYV